MIDIKHEVVAEILGAAASEVFSSMLGSEIEILGTSQDVICDSGYDGVLSFIGLAGSYVGNGFLVCSAATACDLAARFVMSEAKTIDDEVLDAISELTNIIVGSTKNSIEDRLGLIQMSIPTSLYGKNISVRSMKTELTVPVTFRYEGGKVVVCVCLASSPGETRSLRHC